MPFLSSNSPYYRVEITLPGYGKTPRLSTKTERKAVAKRMEECLRYVWEDGHYELVEALEPEGPGQGGKIDLPTLFHAWRRGELEKLARRIDDPLLRAAVKAFKKHVDYGPTLRGLRHLLRIAVTPGGPLLAGEGARLSWLYEPPHIDRLTGYMIREEGYAENTVQIGLWGAISKLLQHHLGQAETRAIMDRARRPSADDRRDVVLSAEDLHNVVSASEWEMRMFLLLKASTGIDKSPLLRIRRRDVDFDAWTIYVRDRKTRSRSRAMDLAPVALFTLLTLLDDKEPHEKAFSLTIGQIDYRWRKAREETHLTKEHGYEKGVRLKDLRHTFAAHYVRAGGNIAGLMGRLRHRREEQSLMYARYETNGTADVEAAARAMGLRLPERLREQLPDPGEEKRQELLVPAWWFDRKEPPRLPGEDGPRIVEAPQRYQERGTAGFAEDPNEYYRRRRERKKAQGQ